MENDFKTDADKDGGSYIIRRRAAKKKAGVNWRCDVNGNVQDRYLIP